MASGYSDMSEIQKDGRNFGSYPRPAKINLLSEEPRRESLVEQQLTTKISRPVLNYGQIDQQQARPYIQQQQVFANQSNRSQQQDFIDYYNRPSSIQHMGERGDRNYTVGTVHERAIPLAGSSRMELDRDRFGYAPHEQYNPRTKTVTTTVKTTTTSSSSSAAAAAAPEISGGSDNTWRLVEGEPGGSKPRVVYREPPGVPVGNYSDLTAELLAKEAKLKREIAYLNQHVQNPWSRPVQVREPRREPAPRVARSDQRWVREFPSAPTSRPGSRASSTRSTTEADLLEKAAKLLQDVQEIERKPLNRQQILIESGAAGSSRPPSGSPTNGSDGHQRSASSIHTAIIQVPDHEIDNKSPLPFAFDNFSTLGVRGNIASVGAAEPEKPYPPIFPLIKRTPSPAGGR